MKVELMLKLSGNISFEVFLSLFRLIFLHQKRRFRPRNFQFSSLEHTKRKLNKFISLQYSGWSLVEINRGYYMPARGYEFYLLVVNSISHE